MTTETLGYSELIRKVANDGPEAEREKNDAIYPETVSGVSYPLFLEDGKSACKVALLP